MINLDKDIGNDYSNFVIKFFDIDKRGYYVCKYCDKYFNPNFIMNSLYTGLLLICHVLVYHCKTEVKT